MRERERVISTRYLLCENTGPRFSPLSYTYLRICVCELPSKSLKLSTLLAVAPRRLSASADRRECTACACKPPRIKAAPDRLCYYERSWSRQNSDELSQSLMSLPGGIVVATAAAVAAVVVARDTPRRVA